MAKADVWMPLYIGDYLADTRRLTTEQHGAYLLLLMDYWRNGPPPDDAQTLAQITLLSPDAWSIAQAKLKHFFSIEDGIWRHKRVDAELAAAQENRGKAQAKAKAAAEARWGKNKGNASVNSQGNASGNAPSIAQAMPKKCPSPSPSPSDNPSGKNPSSGQSPDGAQQVQKRARKEGSAEDFTAARWMFDLVRKVNPAAKEPKFDSWANDVRLMRELDGRTHKEICELFQWAKKDAFWCANIQSPAKLREKWDTLTERRMQKASPGAVALVQQGQPSNLDAIRQANNEEAKRLLFGNKSNDDDGVIDA